MTSTSRRRGAVLCGAVWLALSVLTPVRQAAADPAGDCEQAYAGCDSTPPGMAETVGTAVHVVIHKSFAEIPGQDQCVGTSTLSTIHRGASVVLSEGSPLAGTQSVAVGELFRSRLRDGMCEVLYIVSAPVMPVFNLQFIDPDGGKSPTFGPVASEAVTDQPGILQAVQIDIEVEPQG